MRSTWYYSVKQKDWELTFILILLFVGYEENFPRRAKNVLWKANMIKFYNTTTRR